MSVFSRSSAQELHLLFCLPLAPWVRDEDLDTARASALVVLERALGEFRIFNEYVHRAAFKKGKEAGMLWSAPLRRSAGGTDRFKVGHLTLHFTFAVDAIDVLPLDNALQLLRERNSHLFECSYDWKQFWLPI